MCGNEQKVWFAMRATYGRNMEVKKKLDEAGFESFVPMRYVVSLDRRGRKTKKFVPVVRDLVFIRTDQATMYGLKQQFESLRNIYIPSEDGRKRVVIVTDDQMDSFMKEMEDAGIKTDVVSPKLLPRYTHGNPVYDEPNAKLMK